jgi:hypothetical protein
MNAAFKGRDTGFVIIDTEDIFLQRNGSCV